MYRITIGPLLTEDLQTVYKRTFLAWFMYCSDMSGRSEKNGEKFQNDKCLGRNYDTGLPDCTLSANQTWPPPLSRRYQEEDAHRPPLAGMAPLSSRRCGKQRFTWGTICSLFAV